MDKRETQTMWSPHEDVQALSTEDGKTGFKGSNIITLSWHFCSKEFKELQKAPWQKYFIRAKMYHMELWNNHRGFDGLLVFKEIEYNKTCRMVCEMKGIKDNEFKENRALVTARHSVCPSLAKPFHFPPLQSLQLLNRSRETANNSTLTSCGLRNSTNLWIRVWECCYYKLHHWEHLSTCPHHGCLRISLWGRSLLPIREMSNKSKRVITIVFFKR